MWKQRLCQFSFVYSSSMDCQEYSSQQYILEPTKKNYVTFSKSLILSSLKVPVLGRYTELRVIFIHVKVRFYNNCVALWWLYINWSKFKLNFVIIKYDYIIPWFTWFIYVKEKYSKQLTMKEWVESFLIKDFFLIIIESFFYAHHLPTITMICSHYDYPGTSWMYFFRYEECG